MWRIPLHREFNGETRKEEPSKEDVVGTSGGLL
jgi:hypothetical protein